MAHNYEKIASGQTLRELAGTEEVNFIQKFPETRMTDVLIDLLKNNRTVRELAEKTEPPDLTSVCDRNYAHA